MYWYGISFVPVNFLFLVLGAMLLMLATQNNIALPALADEILPLFATTYLGKSVLVCLLSALLLLLFERRFGVGSLNYFIFGGYSRCSTSGQTKSQTYPYGDSCVYFHYLCVDYHGF